jgi:hypothetical protein
MFDLIFSANELPFTATPTAPAAPADRALRDALDGEPFDPAGNES